MACYLPIDVRDRGRVPCGQCIGCRLEYSRQWAVRSMHEASMHEENCFLTLTVQDGEVVDGVRIDRTLHKPLFPAFMRRLRKAHPGVRYFHCGEYGERTGRPHYHALLFGFDFEDKTEWSVRNNLPVWRSAELEDLWRWGVSELGSVTFESAAYVSGYITKKVTGKNAANHYLVVDDETGEIWRRVPEFATMSRRPGIGGTWLARFRDDVYPSDSVVMRGREMRPPRFYDKQLKREELEALWLKREKDVVNWGERTRKRLKVRGVVAEAKANLFAREMD